MTRYALATVGCLAASSGLTLASIAQSHVDTFATLALVLLAGCAWTASAYRNTSN